MEEFKVGDLVSLPFGEEGVVVDDLGLPWGHTKVVRILKGVFNPVGSNQHYKPEQLIKLDCKGVTYQAKGLIEELIHCAKEYGLMQENGTAEMLSEAEADLAKAEFELRSFISMLETRWKE